jgi:hypothetical protein
MAFASRLIALSELEGSPPVQQQDSKPVKRTMSGLRDAMFDVLERVRDGRLSAKDAKEACNAARVILESIDTQLTFEASRSAGTIEVNDLPALPLADDEDA